MMDKRVRCPKCQSEFVFAPGKDKAESPAVTDTGVMRILGETASLPPIPQRHSEQPESPTLKQCARCGTSISVNAAVCSHCNCYVGVMPQFMEQMFPGRSSAGNAD